MVNGGTRVNVDPQTEVVGRNSGAHYPHRRTRSMDRGGVFYDVGEMVPAFSPVVEVADLAHVYTTVYVEERTLARIQPGQEVRVRTVLDERTGTVVKLPTKAEFSPKEVRTPETREALVYGVKVLIPNDDLEVKIGMPVEVSFQ
mgnify:CR=1 FL=1